MYICIIGTPSKEFSLLINNSEQSKTHTHTHTHAHARTHTLEQGNE